MNPVREKKMRALSLEKDKDIAESVSLDNEIQTHLGASFEKAIGVDTPADAILFIGNRVAHGQVEEYRIQKAETALDKNFLPAEFQRLFVYDSFTDRFVN